MAKKKPPATQTGVVGLPADLYGNPAIDPTANVIALVDLNVQRVDDLRLAFEHSQNVLREQEQRHVGALFELRHDATVARESAFREAAELRDRHAQEMRKAEADRLDAIRSVDVAAVQQAATVQAAAASALETSVSAAAETLRTTVAATAAAAATELRSTVAPLIEAIADLRRVQYEQQGQRVGVTETKGTAQVTMGTIIAIAGVILLFVSVIAAVVGLLVTQ